MKKRNQQRTVYIVSEGGIPVHAYTDPKAATLHAADWLMDCRREEISVEVHLIDNHVEELWQHVSLEDRAHPQWFPPYWTTTPEPRPHLARRKQVRIQLPIPAPPAVHELN